MQMTRNTGSRRSAVVIYTVVLVGVAAVFAVLMLTNLTSVPTSSAPAAQSSGEMPGMDHGAGQVPASSPPPAPTGAVPSGEMPGMDHGASTPATTPARGSAGGWPEKTHEHGSAGDSPAKADQHGSAGDSPAKADEHGSGEMPGMDMPGDSGEHGDAPAADVQRPLVPVLGAFGGGTAAVLLTAGMMRSKDRKRLQARQAARAARATLRSAK